MILRRRQLPPELSGSFAAFCDVLAELEPAKKALTDVMPTTRLPGMPLPAALAAFEDGLLRAQAAMPGWRRIETEEAWAAGAAGIDEALARARRLREDPPDLRGFEGLIWAVERLLEPLEAFEDAAARFSSLRRR